MDHVRKGDKECPAKHQKSHDTQSRERYRKQEEEPGEGDPLDAAQVGRDLGLRGGVDALEKSLSEHAVVDHRLVDEPCEARGTVNLSLPLCRAGWTEEDEVLESEE